MSKKNAPPKGATSNTSARPTRTRKAPTAGRAGVQDAIGHRAQKGWSTRGADPDYMRKIKPIYDFALDRYFRVENLGWERLPKSPCLLVGIHSGTWLTMDAWAFVFSWWRRFGTDRLLHGTAHDVLMAMPGLGSLFRNVGVIPAARESVTQALAAGNSVIVWPGGEVDAMRSWRKRHEVHFGGRRGFVKQAILSGVPIVPVATIGGTETVFVLSEGRWLAKVLQFKRLLRSETLPIVAGFPFGIWPEIVPSHIPLPSKIYSEILEPIFVDTDPERAKDDHYVNSVFEEVQARVAAGVQHLVELRRQGGL